MKKKLLLCCLTAAMLIQSAAGAAVIKSVDYNAAGQKLTVTGSGEGSGQVTLRVLKPGIKKEDLEQMTAAEQIDAVAYLKQADPGEFTFVYTPETLATWGNYNIYITDSTGDTKYEYKLMLDSATSTALMNALNTASSKELMKAVFTNYPNFLSGITTVDEIKAKYSEDEVFDSIAGMMAGMNFTDPDSAAKEAVKAAIVTDINKSSAADIITIIRNYNKELGFEDNLIYKDYYMSDDAYAQAVSANFAGRNYLSAVDFCNDFNTVIILNKLNGITNYTENAGILTAAEAYLTAAGANYSAFNTLDSSKKNTVYSILAGKNNYSSIAEVKEAFNAAVVAAQNTNSGNQGGSGGNSGGSSGGGSSSSSGNNNAAAGISKTTEPSSGTFDDLGLAEWARESIVALYNKGIVSGVSSTKFDPQGQVTREQFAKMIISACGLYDAYASCDFSDVSDGAWYKSYVASAVNNGVVFGVDENNFGTGLQITREDMAVMAYRAAVKAGKISGAANDESFADESEISEYAKEAVHALRAAGIMSGKGDGKFEPKAFATRAEAARMIYGLISR